MMLHEENVSSYKASEPVSEEDRHFIRWPSMNDLDDDTHCDLEDREVKFQSEGFMHDLETWDE